MDELYGIHSVLAPSNAPSNNNNVFRKQAKMDELYGIHSVLAPSNAPSNNNNVFSLGVDDIHHHHHHHHHQTSMINGGLVISGDEGQQGQHHHHLLLTSSNDNYYNSDENSKPGGGGVEMMMSDVVKAQIASHPLYPNLVSAYIQCRKVAAPPEMAALLEELSKVTQPITTTTTAEIGADPELDEFMESYCEVLYKYKEELSKPFDEAKTFLSSIESQLSNLCKDTFPTTSNSYHSGDEAGGTSEEDLSCGEVEVAESQDYLNNSEGDQQIKEMLMRKYSGYLSSLRKEFLKKRKKGKLPKDARVALLDWWNSHYRWPYPTEEEKNKLSEATGLDQKQINNWFINQRKRHWRPSEDMRFTLMEGVSGDVAGSMYFDAGGGTGNLGI